MSILNDAENLTPYAITVRYPGDEETEVVVTNETEVYVDVTSSKIGELEDGDTLRQTLKPGSIEELGSLSFVQVWGERRGDRIIADFLVYMLPLTIVGR